MKNVCQRPERAYFISTLVSKGGIAMKWCQRPERAYFISTESKEGSRSRRKFRCVNALNGLTSFLLKGWQKSLKVKRKCVNALNGLTSFLLGKKGDTMKKTMTLCQRPERAYFISTRSAKLRQLAPTGVSTP